MEREIKIKDNYENIDFLFKNFNIRFITEIKNEEFKITIRLSEDFNTKPFENINTGIELIQELYKQKEFENDKLSQINKFIKINPIMETNKIKTIKTKITRDMTDNEKEQASKIKDFFNSDDMQLLAQLDITKESRLYKDKTTKVVSLIKIPDVFYVSYINDKQEKTSFAIDGKEISYENENDFDEFIQKIDEININKNNPSKEINQSILDVITHLQTIGEDKIAKDLSQVLTR